MPAYFGIPDAFNADNKLDHYDYQLIPKSPLEQLIEGIYAEEIEVGQLKSFRKDRYSLINEYSKMSNYPTLIYDYSEFAPLRLSDA